jgi:hypothetical protein
MYLVELFIPLFNNDDERFSRSAFEELEKTLTDRFGGLTGYPRTPASGIWNNSQGSTRDELVVYEVMTESIDTQWWYEYRKSLEAKFQQESVLIRAQESVRL